VVIVQQELLSGAVWPGNIDTLLPANDVRH